MSRQGSESDTAILKKVNQHLTRMSCRVNAAIHNGQVTLSGNIQYENQRRPALKAAGSVEGVRGVSDQLKVTSR
ncbi:MAG: BON domain-containing protein [Planctomycetia bacterium]|jgi:osmotically-inducible protein OsmY|nr:BON domain-containing protein [Planctomycetia bacterium]